MTYSKQCGVAIDIFGVRFLAWPNIMVGLTLPNEQLRKVDFQLCDNWSFVAKSIRLRPYYEQKSVKIGVDGSDSFHTKNY